MFNSRHAGRRAGGTHLSNTGYRRIVLLGEWYLEHRLAHFYMTGEWPKDEIDHVYGNRGDNRWDKLREATDQQNAINAAIRRDNTSGFKGVYFDKTHHRWKAQIGAARKSLGSYSTKDEAIAARVDAEAAMHGEWRRTG